MKILVVGGGGREHAIVWSLSKSPAVDTIYCAPGNAGIAGLATCVDIPATNVEQMTAFAVSEQIDRVFVAPDDPLAMGMVDRLNKAGIKAYGPRADAARLEASKSFSKELMKNNGIPTARYAGFSNEQDAIRYLEKQTMPVVVKADGLALGKGVVIAWDLYEAKAAVHSMLSEKAFGEAGSTILIEEYLTGPELTVLAFTDGKTVVPMPCARDHKRALDGDKGKNTGGMGVVVPGYTPSDAEMRQWTDLIFQPTVDAMCALGSPFHGILYFGLMLTDQGPKVIEYNARFGDPEAQAILPLLQTDLLTIMEATIEGDLGQINIEWTDKASCCVVMASGGYPESYEKGYIIEGLDKVSSLVFHAGTCFDNGRVVTNGGRVLGVTAIEDQLSDAIESAYSDIRRIHFQDAQYRNDIGRSTIM